MAIKTKITKKELAQAMKSRIDEYTSQPKMAFDDAKFCEELNAKFDLIKGMVEVICEQGEKLKFGEVQIDCKKVAPWKNVLFSEFAIRKNSGKLEVLVDGQHKFTVNNPKEILREINNMETILRSSSYVVEAATQGATGFSYTKDDAEHAKESVDKAAKSSDSSLVKPPIFNKQAQELATQRRQSFYSYVRQMQKVRDAKIASQKDTIAPSLMLLEQMDRNAKLGRQLKEFEAKKGVIFDSAPLAIV